MKGERSTSERWREGNVGGRIEYVRYTWDRWRGRLCIMLQGQFRKF